jgi:8-oxo-dGTP pyrophosphatase MutT (NUDIX family)
MNSAASIMPTSQFAQVAALPLMVGDDGIARVLLLTSRETKRWDIPKGWPMRGRKPHEAAAQEALEEAGVTGQAKKKPIGVYEYFKRREAHFDVCKVEVYLLRVEKQLKNWREKGQREAQWFTLDEAADLVEEPGLVALLRDLAKIGLAKGAFNEVSGNLK